MKISFILLFSFGLVFGGGIQNVNEIEPPIFVSLGSYCDPAHLLRHCDLRKVGFPFDWIVSMDGEKLIEMFDTDFEKFLDDDYLFVSNDILLLHTYYHLEFLHEGHWGGDQYEMTMHNFKNRYKRRIERLRQLKNYKGKVIFMRAAYLGSLSDLHRTYRVKENLEITDDNSLKLCQALERYYPNLDFNLLIINHGKNFKMRKYSDKRILLTVDLHMNVYDRIDLCCDCFKRLN